jgi:mannose-6-phosphate isomerase-like protein (cupin superfamily)
MLHKTRQQAVRHKNSLSCTVWEYGSVDGIDAADALVDGRYPEQGFALNEISDMSVRVLSGMGRLATQQASVTLAPGDVVMIPHGEPYYFEGQDLAFFMACSPAWSIDQYKEISQ